MDAKWKRRLTSVTIALAIISSFVFFFVCRELKVKRYETRELSEFEYFTDYEYTQVEEKKNPQGVIDVISFKVPYDVKDDMGLVFYSVHENVEVFIDGRMVYSCWVDKNNPFGHTPGDLWNEVPLRMSDAGKEVEIHLIPVYKAHVGTIPDIMLGNVARIYMNYMARQVVPFSCALAAVVIGCIFVLISIMDRKNKQQTKGLLEIGILAIVLGAWKMSDLSILRVYIQHPVELSYRALFLIMFLVLPFAFYQNELYNEHRHKGFVAVIIFSLSAIAISVLLQVLNIADLRETLFLHHIALLALIAISIIAIIREIKVYGWNQQLKITVCCFVICIIGVIGDLMIYYSSLGRAMDSFGMVGFLIYITVLGVNSIREAQALMDIGRSAVTYRDLAYTDKLTGLCNRNAYAQCVEDETFSPEHCTMVMFDLNDLKKCNDTYGHEAGDIYIQMGAQFINETFGKLGVIYRMGGDEFCAILRNVSDDACQEAWEEMQKRAEAYDQQENHPFKIKIACGFLSYDMERDYDISDTLRRADHKMYENKMQMKQNK